MNYSLLKDVIDLMEQFESKRGVSKDIDGFMKWVSEEYYEKDVEPEWEGKEQGRSSESVINTLIVHMNRYAKAYSKSAIIGSDFATQEDFIYLINLKAFGEMTKMALIRKNVHEKSVGMQIINRLIQHKWIDQYDSPTDKRSKMISINKKGLKALDKQMNKIRQATKIVTGDLTHKEKMELIRLLSKLNDFHLDIYDKNIDPENLIDEVMNESKFSNN